MCLACMQEHSILTLSLHAYGHDIWKIMITVFWSYCVLTEQQPPNYSFNRSARGDGNAGKQNLSIMTLVTQTDKWLKFLPFSQWPTTFVGIREFQTSLLLRGHNTNTKSKSVFISASAPRTNYTWMQENSPHPRSGNVEAFWLGTPGAV